MNSKLRIGISLRVTSAPNYYEKRDALSQDWPPFLEGLNVVPVFIPNTLADVESFLEDMHLDGFVLSGGDNLGDDLERDETEKKILTYGIDKHLPIFGVCRGMQLINTYFGGSIIKSSNHKHVGKPHPVEISSAFSNLLGANIIDVNSYHNNIIPTDCLGNGLEPFAICINDKTVEGLFHTKYPIMGVMWHPERNPDKNSILILKKTFHSKNN